MVSIEAKEEWNKRLARAKNERLRCTALVAFNAAANHLKQLDLKKINAFTERMSSRDLDRIAAWTRVFGMVNSAPGFTMQPSVINGFSDLVIELFGPEVGAHSRSAVGMAELPFGIPVEIEAEVELKAG